MKKTRIVFFFDFQTSKMESVDRELSKRCPGWDKSSISYTAVSFLELMKILIKYSIPDGSDKKENRSSSLTPSSFSCVVSTTTIIVCWAKKKRKNKQITYFSCLYIILFLPWCGCSFSLGLCCRFRCCGDTRIKKQWGYNEIWLQVLYPDHGRIWRKYYEAMKNGTIFL